MAEREPMRPFIIGFVCLVAGWLVLILWNRLKEAKWIEKCPQKTFTLVSNIGALAIFISQVLVQNDVVDGTSFWYAIIYLIAVGCLLFSSLKNFNSGFVLLSASLAALLSYNIAQNTFGLF